MALSLKDKETDRLAREMVALTGETLTDAIRNSLAERLERERLRRGRPGDLAARIREIGEHCAALPDYDTRTPDDYRLRREWHVVNGRRYVSSGRNSVSRTGCRHI